jgi:hypothetical protein
MSNNELEKQYHEITRVYKTMLPKWAVLVQNLPNTPTEQTGTLKKKRSTQ